MPIAAEGRQELLARGAITVPAGSGLVAKPGSGATITLWTSQNTANQATGTADTSTPNGYRFKRLIINVLTDQNSAASGLVVQESDDGTNWNTLTSASVVAGTRTKLYVSVAAPDVRVQYTNIAAVLGVWQMSILGDEYERASQ